MNENPFKKTPESDPLTRLKKTNRHTPEKLKTAEVLECGPYIQQCEQLIEEFLTDFSLDELNAIQGVFPQHFEDNPLRNSAKAAIKPIAYLLNNVFLQKTNISAEQYDQLMRKYLPLGYAIGRYMDDVLTHEPWAW